MTLSFVTLSRIKSVALKSCQQKVAELEKQKQNNYEYIINLREEREALRAQVRELESENEKLQRQLKTVGSEYSQPLDSASGTSITVPTGYTSPTNKNQN